MHSLPRSLLTVTALAGVALAVVGASLAAPWTAAAVAGLAVVVALPFLAVAAAVHAATALLTAGLVVPAGATPFRPARTAATATDAD